MSSKTITLEESLSLTSNLVSFLDGCFEVCELSGFIEISFWSMVTVRLPKIGKPVLSPWGTGVSAAGLDGSLDEGMYLWLDDRPMDTCERNISMLKGSHRANLPGSRNNQARLTIHPASAMLACLCASG